LVVIRIPNNPLSHSPEELQSCMKIGNTSRHSLTNKKIKKPRYNMLPEHGFNRPRQLRHGECISPGALQAPQDCHKSIAPNWRISMRRLSFNRQ